jgi:hypothetical protein
MRQGCPVCGASEVARDEVLDTGVMLLSTCRRCDHRWTGRPLRAVATRHTDVEITTAA